MILAVDIGNTDTVLGLFLGDDLARVKRVRTSSLKDEVSVIRMLQGFKRGKLDGAIVSSVVPGLTPHILGSIKKGYGIPAMRVSNRLNSGLKIRIKKPEELGADRLVNAACAFKEYGGPVIVVDFGTATTLCAVSGKGEYMGGAIMPGLGISVEALARNTARLKRIRLTGTLPLTGNSTASAMRLGIVEGHAGAVIHLVQRMTRAFSKKPRVIATGGLASWMARRIPVIERVDPDLTLKGLKFLYDLNSR